MTTNHMAESKTILMLFDLHKFMPNRRLQLLIGAVGRKYGLTDSHRELSDDELEVWAAGDLSAANPKKKLFGDKDDTE